MQVTSPNLNVKPVTTTVDARGHLVIGGCDTVELAKRFGTPLWVVDERTIKEAVQAVHAGLSDYRDYQVLYAGKAFLCLAMCHLVRDLGLGLDVVSSGELFTAVTAGFPSDRIYMHGNNKSAEELRQGLMLDGVKIVVDNESELELLARLSAETGRTAAVLLRLTPGVEPDTHHYIRTGQFDSKFGMSLAELGRIVRLARGLDGSVRLVGLHAHIGSQAHDIEPYLEIVDILADCFAQVKRDFALDLSELDVGGGLGIAYTDSDSPLPMDDWARSIAQRVKQAFPDRGLELPRLLLEPGRAIVGTAGVTLYTAGHKKTLPNGLTYLAVDGGMADNPRPVMYQARYTPALAGRMDAPRPVSPLTIVGKYCESGDIIVRDAYLAADTGDLIAVFGTGAYNYSMASNYNRTGRPACVLVSEGRAEVVIDRESNADLIQHDRVPDRFLIEK